MKDSGVEWLGEIPKHWQKRRIKTLFTLRSEKNYLPLNQVNLISLYTEKGVIQHDDLEDTTGNKASNADGYKKVYENDIIVNIILCWMGAIGRSAYTGVTSPAYDVYIPSKFVNSEFYHYYFRTPGFSGECYKRGRGIMAMRWRTYSDEFRSIEVVFPPLSEQTAIASYLDKKCAAIDEIIAEAKATIDEYKSWKASVIFEAVTKGLNPNAEMKDSGVEWIGRIPKHWPICKIKYLCSMQAGKNLTSEDIQDSGTYPVYGGNGLRGYYSSYNQNRSCLLVGRQGALCGNVHYVSGKFWATDHAVVTIPSSLEQNRHLYYLLVCMNLNQYALNTAAQPGLSVTLIQNLPTLLTPLTEQTAIAAYLDEKCAAIDGVIAEKEALIGELESYKKSLIFETVTGKRRVAI